MLECSKGDLPQQAALVSVCLILMPAGQPVAQKKKKKERNAKHIHVLKQLSFN